MMQSEAHIQPSQCQSARRTGPQGTSAHQCTHSSGDITENPDGSWFQSDRDGSFLHDWQHSPSNHNLQRRLKSHASSRSKLAHTRSLAHELRSESAFSETRSSLTSAPLRLDGSALDGVDNRSIMHMLHMRGKPRRLTHTRSRNDNQTHEQSPPTQSVLNQRAATSPLESAPLSSSPPSSFSFPTHLHPRHAASFGSPLLRDQQGGREAKQIEESACLVARRHATREAHPMMPGAQNLTWESPVHQEALPADNSSCNIHSSCSMDDTPCKQSMATDASSSSSLSSSSSSSSAIASSSCADSARTGDRGHPRRHPGTRCRRRTETPHLSPHPRSKSPPDHLHLLCHSISPLASSISCKQAFLLSSESARAERFGEACTTPGVPQRPPLLPPRHPSDHRPTLVLDLDETLVHSTLSTEPFAGAMFAFDTGQRTYYVKMAVRPGVPAFLAVLAEYYELVLFTAAQQVYTEPILDLLDPDGSIFSHHLFHESCHRLPDRSIVKDLSRLGRDLAHVIIVDNTPSCYCWHVSNAVPVSSWYWDPSDTELLQLVPMLCQLASTHDVRPRLRATFQLQHPLSSAPSPSPNTRWNVESPASRSACVPASNSA